MLNCETLKDVVQELEPSVGQRVMFERDQFEQLWTVLKDAAIRLEVMEHELMDFRNHLALRNGYASGVAKVVELRPSAFIHRIPHNPISPKTPDDAA